jgi:flagellar L-ring protein precursor FlgH
MRLVLLTLALLAATDAFGQSMYADPTARAVGDPITVILAERTSASSQAQYQDRSDASLSGSGSAEGGTFGVGAQFSQDASAQNAAVQSDLLTGTLTAVVTGLDAQGNLQIAGERSLHVNGVTHLMKVEGTVRPLDVRYDNTVLSHQIANAEVEYRQKGLAPKFFRPATLVKAAAVALVGLAYFLASGSE